MYKQLKRILFLVLIFLVIYIPTTEAFLDIIIDILDDISNALNQLEILTLIKDFEEIQKDLAVKWDEIRELQEDISKTIDLGKRWYYFETSLTNQNIIGNFDSFFGGPVYNEYKHLVNHIFGMSGTIRNNPEYGKTIEYLTKLFGMPSKNNYQVMDPEQYLLYNQLITGADNINAAGNMDAYTGRMIGSFQEWIDDTSGIIKKDYVSQEALLKCLLKFHLVMVDYYKLSINFMSSQLRYCGVQAIEKYFDRSVEVNNNKRYTSAYGQSSSDFLNYLVSEAGDN